MLKDPKILNPNAKYPCDFDENSHLTAQFQGSRNWDTAHQLSGTTSGPLLSKVFESTSFGRDELVGSATSIQAPNERCSTQVNEKNFLVPSEWISLPPPSEYNQALREIIHRSDAASTPVFKENQALLGNQYQSQQNVNHGKRKWQDQQEDEGKSLEMASNIPFDGAFEAPVVSQIFEQAPSAPHSSSNTWATVPNETILINRWRTFREWGQHIPGVTDKEQHVQLKILRHRVSNKRKKIEESFPLENPPTPNQTPTSNAEKVKSHIKAELLILKETCPNLKKENLSSQSPSFGPFVARLGKEIILKNPGSFPNKDNFFKKISQNTEKSISELFSGFDINKNKSMAVWNFEHILFPIFVYQISWTYKFFTDMKIQSNFSKIESAFEAGYEWYKYLVEENMKEYMKTVKASIKRGIWNLWYSTRDTVSNEGPYQTIHHLEFSRTARNISSITWKIFLDWLKEYENDGYLAVGSGNSFGMGEKFKSFYNYQVWQKNAFKPIPTSVQDSFRSEVSP
ncbi:hypothetical protein CROQUDRAFT_717454 [Cronartium quercuum f. sp. fusiforme G11]|uniref:Uncharacterized protein n=1 Tax=Cronartium quercuum f. sp. fusiforme G11 TaxID=708437 RepID=A0A9P6T8C9_9BASI|nr:hypothetical protein CROQUDRAFT_717454 [Cronartium quercuum f. sp. fusiforme G11]